MWTRPQPVLSHAKVFVHHSEATSTSRGSSTIPGAAEAEGRRAAWDAAEGRAGEGTGAGAGREAAAAALAAYEKPAFGRADEAEAEAAAAAIEASGT